MPIKVYNDGAFVDAVVSAELSERDLPPLLEALEAARRRGPFVVLTDTLAMTAAPRPAILAFADGLKKLPSMSGLWLGDAVVANSSVVRFVLSTLILVAPMPTEVKVFDARAPAERWCGDILRTGGQPVPESLKKARTA